MVASLGTRRWAIAHVATLVAVTAFVSLGLWQLGRLDERRAFNRRLLARSSMPVVSVGSLFPRGPSSARDAAAAAYRRVEVRGRFDAGREVVLLSRSFRGRSGHHLLTPVVTSEGAGLIVDRGWVPLDLHDPPVVEAAPPPGIVTLRGFLLPSQRRGRFGPEHPPTGALEGVFRVDVPRLQAQLPYRVYPVYLLLGSQDPAQPGALPERVEPPRLDAGPHLSYAIQWFAFAAIALATWGALVRRARRRAR